VLRHRKDSAGAEYIINYQDGKQKGFVHAKGKGNKEITFLNFTVQTKIWFAKTTARLTSAALEKFLSIISIYSTACKS
jgi:hypothetical protein